MARKIRKRKVKPTATVKLAPAQLRFPGELKQYWLAVGAVIWGCVLIAGTGFYFTRTLQWLYLAAWPIGSILLVNWLSNRPRRKQLKQLGPSARVFGTNHPELGKQLKEVADLLGIRKLPQMYLVEDEDPYIYSMAGGKGAIILTDSLVSLLRREELAVLLARELAHLKYGHVRLERALWWIRAANPIFCIALLPLWFWSGLMGEWLDLIDYTADRAAVLATGSPTLVNATIVKAAAGADPQANVTPQEVDDFLNQPDGLDLNAAQMEAQFKLNRFVESIPNLRDRITQVSEFANSEEGQLLMEQVNAVREKLGGAA